MPQVEQLKIFLASPSDVANERRYVEEVIKEINETVASSQDIVIELVHSGLTYPGYGQDGQAVLNAQIASMEEYALFVGIMWNRVGTPTPRAESGTIEEFERAVTALERKGQPQIWFYFRQSAAQLNTEGELEQRRKVLDFEKKVQRNALTHEYKNPSNFRDQFRQDILLWLNERKPPLGGDTTPAPVPQPTTGQATSSVTPRLQAFYLLKVLLPAQFDEVIFLYEVDESQLSTNVTQVQKAKEVIKLANQKEGDSLSGLLNAIYQAAPHLKR